jgi:hypothetical protein
MWRNAQVEIRQILERLDRKYDIKLAVPVRRRRKICLPVTSKSGRNGSASHAKRYGGGGPWPRS